MEREERTKKENGEKRDFREDRRDFLKEIFNSYRSFAFPRIDVLVDKASVEEGRIIDNIEKSWSALFEEDEVFNKELIETYLYRAKGSYLKYKKQEVNFITLEYILLDTAIKRAIIDAKDIEDVTSDKIFDYVTKLIIGYRRKEASDYIEKILRRYALYTNSKDKVFKHLRKWFKSYEKEINQLFNDAAEKIINLRNEKRNTKFDEDRKQDVENKEQVENTEINLNPEHNIEQESNKDLEVNELKERLTTFELEYKRLNKRLDDLNNTLVEQRKNTIAELINTLNEESFGLVLDRLYMWAFMNLEYDENDVKLYIKNLFRALEKIDVYADSSNLLGLIDLQADEIGTKYRLNKDMGIYSPGYKKVIFPGWKYKDEYLINPMIEV